METAYSDGIKTGVVDFPYEEVDRGNPLAAELEKNETAGDALHDLFLWCWSTPSFKFSFVRFVAISAVMRPDLLDDLSYEQLAKKLNCTKALISYNAKQFQKEFGVHFRRSRRLDGCEKMSAAARMRSFNSRASGKFNPE